MSASRFSYPEVPVICGGGGPERVGSHPPSAECGGNGDVSRDGVKDLGGGVSEVTLDAFQTFDGPCWDGTPGIHVNPRCGDDSAPSTVRRGGGWAEGMMMGMSALRRRSIYFEAGATFGFRCVYPDGT
jgi:formylglycine-generating enzyme required for sulfatase activity